MLRRLTTLWSNRVATTTPVFHNAVVASSGGDYTTLAAAEAALTAPFVVVVKTGTYAGTTLAKAGLWIFDPGTIINTTALTVTGNKTGLVFGPGCDIQVLYQHTGTDAFSDMHNGVASVGLIFDGLRPFLSGGGWGSISNGGSTQHGLYFDDSPAATDGMALNIEASTTSTGAAVRSIKADAIRTALSGVKVSQSDGSAITTTVSTNTDLLILGCLTLDCDVSGFLMGGPRFRAIANYFLSSGTDGISPSGAGDNSVMVANIIKDPAESGILIGTNDEDCVVVGNRVDPDGTGNAIDDNSGTSTVTANNTTTF